MAEPPVSVVVLYALADLTFAVLVGTVLALPLAVPALAWWLRR